MGAPSLREPEADGALPGCANCMEVMLEAAQQLCLSSGLGHVTLLDLSDGPKFNSCGQA